MACEHPKEHIITGEAVHVCTQCGSYKLLCHPRPRDRVWQFPRNAARLDKLLNWLLEVVKAWRYGGMSTAVFCTAVDELIESLGPQGLPGKSFLSREGNELPQSVVDAIGAAGKKRDAGKPLASSRPCPSCGGDNDSSIGCGMCGGSGRVKNEKPDEDEGDQDPLCDRVGILERLGGRLDTQLQSTWTVASRADRAFTELKARVDELEHGPEGPWAGGVDKRLDDLAFDDGQLRESIEKLAVQHTQCQTDRNGLAEKLGELETLCGLIPLQFAKQPDDAAEVEALVKAGLEYRRTHDSYSHWPAFRDAADALIAKRAEQEGT